MKGKVLFSQLDPAGSWANLDVTVTAVNEGDVTVQDNAQRDLRCSILDVDCERSFS
jgi:hypothetical protein